MIKVLRISLFMGAFFGIVWIQQSLIPKSPQPYTQTRSIMATPFTIIVAAKTNEKLTKVVDKAFAAITRIDKKYSTYKPTSILSRINQNAGKKPVPIDRETQELLVFAQRVSEKSNGSFDITFQSFGHLWHLSPSKFTLPDPQTIQSRLQDINFHNVMLGDKSVRFATHGTKIGMGAYAKGYAIDLAADVLRKAGYQNFVVNGGGDLLFSGRKFNQAWTAGIQHPRHKNGFLMGTFNIEKNTALVTSGDYEKFVTHKGKRYHHIIDPRTGYPARGFRSVTVLAKTAMIADALATALFILGPEKGQKLIQSYDAEAFFVDSKGLFLGARKWKQHMNQL